MIGPLEARIAPAAIVSFTETDGDKITVQTSKGTKAQLEDALNITKGATGISGFTLDLIESPALAAAFAGSVVTISAVKTGGGRRPGRPGENQRVERRHDGYRSEKGNHQRQPGLD